MTHYDPVPAITTRENYGSGKNSDHQRHGLNGQFWSTKRQGQGSSISCRLLCASKTYVHSAPQLYDDSFSEGILQIISW